MVINQPLLFAEQYRNLPVQCGVCGLTVNVLIRKPKIIQQNDVHVHVSQPLRPAH